MDRLLLFHDFASPYCRLAFHAVTDAAQRTGLQVRPVPFELWPAPDPLPAPDDAPVRDEIDTALTLAEEWGVEMRPPPLIPRTRKAHEAVAHAIDNGGVAALTRGIYDALWAHGLDIARLDVLADIAETAGVDRDALHLALGMDTYEADVVREQHAAAGAEMTAVPAVQLGSVVAAGLLPADEIVAWIEENR